MRALIADGREKSAAVRIAEKPLAVSAGKVSYFLL